MDSNVIFEVIEKEEGGFVAGCYDKKLFAEEDTLEALCQAIQEEVDQYWKDDLANKPTGKDIKLLMQKVD